MMFTPCTTESQTINPLRLLHIHVVNDDDIDDEKNFRLFIDVSVNVPDANDDVALSFS
jgi:hypothetical protein